MDCYSDDIKGFPKPEYHSPIADESDDTRLTRWHLHNGTKDVDLIRFRRLAIAVVLEAVRCNAALDDMFEAWCVVAGLSKSQTDNLIEKLKSRDRKQFISR